MRIVEEPAVRRVQLSVALDVDRREVVHHDLSHGVVSKERLERPVAEDVVGRFADEPVAVGRRKRRLIVCEDFAQLLPYAEFQLLGRHVHVVELRAKRLDEALVDLLLQRVERIGLPWRRGIGGNETIPRCGLRLLRPSRL